jgi:hypothetical protein
MQRLNSNPGVFFVVVLSLLISPMQTVLADFGHVSAGQDVSMAHRPCDAQADDEAESQKASEKKCCCSENCALSCLTGCSMIYFGTGLTESASTALEYSVSVFWSGLEQVHVGQYFPPPHRPPRNSA